MRKFTTLFVCLLLTAAFALAADIDGKWVSQRTMDRGGQSMTITQTFDLKADGNKLTGKMTMAMGEMEPRTSEIKDGKIDGNKISFSTMMSTPNGDFTTMWKGTVEGNVLKGTSARDGGQERPFEAKKQ